MVQLLYAIIIMSTSTIEFTTGKRGKENVISDGVRYSLDKKRTTAAGVVNSYWTCVTPGCTSRLVLHDGTISSTPSHKHDEQRAEITVHKANKVLKQSLRTPAREERRALLQPPIRAEQLWILSAWHSPSRLRTWTSQHHSRSVAECSSPWVLLPLQTSSLEELPPPRFDLNPEYQVVGSSELL